MIGGNSAVSVGITMYLRDEFTPNARKIAASNKDLFASIKAESERSMAQQRNMYAGLAAGGALVLGGIGSMIKAGAEFGYVMKGVGTITDSTESQLKSLGNKAKEVGLNSIFTSKEVGEGMRFMAMAGQNYGEVMTNILPATNLAAATMSQLGGKGGAADIMTNVMRGFNIETSRSTEIADKLAYATLRANTNLLDLGEALKYSAATASDLHYQVEDVAAAIMVMGNAGIQGSMAGTAIENMMRYVTMASGQFGSLKQKEALGLLGLEGSDVRDSAGNMKSIYDMLGLIKNRIAGLGTGETQDVLQKIFGVRGKRAGSLLIRDLDTYREFMAGLDSADDKHFAAEKANDLMNTLQGTLLVWTNAWENFKIVFTESLEPMIRGIVKFGTALIKSLTWLMELPGIGKFLPIIVTGFIALRTVAWGIRSAVAALAVAQLRGFNIQKMFFSSGIFGWKGMTLSVKEYIAQMQVATATRAGVMGGASSTIINRGGVNVAGSRGYQSKGNIRNRTMFTNSAGKSHGPIAYGSYNTLAPGTISGGARSTTSMLGKIGTTLGTVGKGILAFLGPVGMILSIGWLLYDVVGSFFNFEKSKDDKLKEVTYDDIMKKFISAKRVPNAELAEDGNSVSNPSKKTAANTVQAAQPVKQTFIFMADGRETMKKEFDDAITRREYFDNKNIYLL